MIDGEAVQLSNVTKDSTAIGEILKEYLNAREPLATFDFYDNFILIASNSQF